MGAQDQKGGRWKRKVDIGSKKVDIGSEKVDIGRKKVDIKTKKLKCTGHGNWELGSHKQVEIPEK